MPLPKTNHKTAAKKNYHHGDLAAELLTAAEIELSKNGIEAFSLRAVAKRAGVSHGAPAHHFVDIRGLLTALAIIGYERLIKTQNNRQNKTAIDPKSQLVASGLGYIDFAVKNPALFKLMFSSEKPNRDDEHFMAATHLAFNKLIDDNEAFIGVNPYANSSAMKDMMARWAIVHGLADMVISGRIESIPGFGQMAPIKKEEVLTDIILTTTMGKTQF